MILAVVERATHTHARSTCTMIKTFPKGDVPTLPEDDATRFLDAVIDQLPAMVFLKTASDLKFVRFNRAGEELLGLSRIDLLGKSDHDLFPSTQANFFVAKDREVLAAKAIVDIAEEPIETPNGTRWLHTRKIPLLDARGVATHLLGISVDVTERRTAEELIRRSHSDLERAVEERVVELRTALDEKRRTEEVLVRTQQQLLHAQKMEAIGRLAGGIAHDFNNILSVILTCADLSLAQLDAVHPLHAELTEIRRAGERAADLTRQLLAFSRQQVLQPRVLDLNDVIRNMERMLHRILGEDIQLAVRTTLGLGRVRVDPSQVEQVLMNLVVNARDAMPMGGKLTIETMRVDLDDAYARDHLGSKPGAHVMLAVSDTGHGMDESVRAQIFEPFYTTKEKGKGTGLGLSTVFGIVQQSGGSIYVYSEPGKGSSFKVYLPCFEGNEQLSDDPRPQARGRGETILIAEDDVAVRRAAVEVLTSCGYALLVASDVHHAIELARTHMGPIHLLLADVVMPQLGGRAVAERIAALRPEIKTLFMSGYTDDAVVRHGVLEEGTPFLQKPLTPKSLAARVREVLDR